MDKRHPLAALAVSPPVDQQVTILTQRIKALQATDAAQKKRISELEQLNSEYRNRVSELEAKALKQRRKK